MKHIEAIIQPYKVDEVKEALVQGGFGGMTISEVRGFGQQRGHREMYRGSEYTVDFVPKIKLELVVDDDQSQKAVDAVLKAAATGNVGDGKIFISDMAEAVRIRTGETGAAAL